MLGDFNAGASGVDAEAYRWSDHSLLIVELAPKSPAVRSLAFSTGKR